MAKISLPIDIIWEISRFCDIATFCNLRLLNRQVKKRLQDQWDTLRWNRLQHLHGLLSIKVNKLERKIKKCENELVYNYIKEVEAKKQQCEAKERRKMRREAEKRRERRRRERRS